MALGRELRDTLGNLGLKGLSLGLERACRLGVVIASARVLGETAFGRFVFASTVTALLALGTDLGLGVWTTRALARRPDDSVQVIRVGLALRGLASLPYGLAVAAVSMLVVQGEARDAIVLLGFAALINAFVDHFGAILRGYERFADEARLNGTRALLTVVAGIAALAVGRSLAAVCGGLAAASLGSCLYGLGTLVRLHPVRGRSVRAGLVRLATVDRALAGSALAQSLPIWLAGLLSMLYFKVDTVFLRSLAGDAELGAYGAAFKLFEGAMILPCVVLAVTFPQLARAHEDPVVQRRLEWHVGMLLLGLGLSVGVVCLLVGGPLVRVVFGLGFGRAVASLRVLALGLPLLYLNYGLTHFLVARDMGRRNLWLAVTMLALNVALDVALIPRGSGPGAAWATVLTEAALTACCFGALWMGAARIPSLPSVPATTRTDQRAA
jgi:O-antigen/teichoic acid export membrane protein